MLCSQVARSELRSGDGALAGAPQGLRRLGQRQRPGVRSAWLRHRHLPCVRDSVGRRHTRFSRVAPQGGNRRRQVLSITKGRPGRPLGDGGGTMAEGTLTPELKAPFGRIAGVPSGQGIVRSSHLTDLFYLIIVKFRFVAIENISFFARPLTSKRGCLLRGGYGMDMRYGSSSQGQ